MPRSHTPAHLAKPRTPQEMEAELHRIQADHILQIAEKYDNTTLVFRLHSESKLVDTCIFCQRAATLMWAIGLRPGEISDFTEDELAAVRAVRDDHEARILRKFPQDAHINVVEWN